MGTCSEMVWPVRLDTNPLALPLDEGIERVTTRGDHLRLRAQPKGRQTVGHLALEARDTCAPRDECAMLRSAKHERVKAERTQMRRERRGTLLLHEP